MEKEHNLLESDVVTLTSNAPLSQLLIWILPNTLHFFRLMKTVEMRTETYGSIALSVIPQAAPIMIFRISKMMMSMTALRISLMNGLIHRNLKALILKNNYFIL